MILVSYKKKSTCRFEPCRGRKQIFSAGGTNSLNTASAKSFHLSWFMFVHDSFIFAHGWRDVPFRLYKPP